jgi:ABC-type Fe3+/spermidine/putrescine transport system ATPase subunit
MSISVQNLVKRYGDRAVIDHVSFEIADGELVSLLGQSGCGKTTTLRCIAGLEQPESGRIEIDGQVVFDSDAGIMVEPYRRSIGMVFQSYAIWPHLSVFENVAFPLRIRREKRAVVEQRVMRALEMVGLGALRDRPSQQLSGGQQQRIAVARAIVHAPAVLLFDEPLSNLDARLRDRTRAEIRRLQRELSVATVYVTHDQAEALSLSDRILVMHAGCIRQQGTPQEIYARPCDPFVADVVGQTNFFDITITGLRAGGVEGCGPGDVPIHAMGRGAIGAASGVMVRPDRLVIAPEDLAQPAPNRLHGIVQQRLFLGGQFEYAVQVGDSVMRVVSPVQVEEAARVCLSFMPEDCVLLAGGGRPEGN